MVLVGLRRPASLALVIVLLPLLLLLVVLGLVIRRNRERNFGSRLLLAGRLRWRAHLLLTLLVVRVVVGVVSDVGLRGLR